MPYDPQAVSIVEQEVLIERIVASRAFRGTDNMPKLLRFLFENRDKLLSAKDIDALLYSRDASKHDPSHAREQASELRKRLVRYQSENPDEPILFELRDANEIGGYQLRVRRLKERASACRRFWAAHLESEKEVSVVCDPLLFFWDRQSGMMFRFMDTNIEGVNRDVALEELETLHKQHYNK